MDVRVRWREEKDRPTVREINNKSFKHAYSHVFDPEEIEGLFADRLEQSASWVQARQELFGVLVAEIESANIVRDIVGFASLAQLKKDGDSELAAFYVLPEYQDRGVGLILWKSAISALKDAGFSGMRVWCMADAGVRRFYEQRGCYKFSEGTYRVGDHTESTIGYRIEL